ncbi:MAG: hypothetical protein NW223_02100 [Hyphomicrobiaceae bacterium]|nr:hypothetical protein [Hyphomicrobiaceae bacterium]
MPIGFGLIEEVAMTTIIEFRGSAARGDTRAGDGKGQGEVIIFPGVRRERHAQAETASGPAAASQLQAQAPPRAKRNRARPKRDRIELPEQ